MNLVVLELEQDKFFVELTSRAAEDLFDDHKDGKTNHIFTQKFKPTSFILESSEASKEDLETITFSYMLDFGIENVRGGEFIELFFTKERTLKLKQLIAIRFDKCFNCLGNHRIKHCTRPIEVHEDLYELIDEIMAGDSSGDEKIKEEDMTLDEKLALKMQMDQMRGERDVGPVDPEDTADPIQICFWIFLFVFAFYAFIFIMLKFNDGKKLKVSFNTGYG